jgi:hypothetical protein
MTTGTYLPNQDKIDTKQEFAAKNEKVIHHTFNLYERVSSVGGQRVDWKLDCLVTLANVPYMKRIRATAYPTHLFWWD